MASSCWDRWGHLLVVLRNSAQAEAVLLLTAQDPGGILVNVLLSFPEYTLAV